jgi:hypothetical protein
VFVVEIHPAPTHNNHIKLPSGIAVIGVDLWVSRFTRLFNQVEGNQEAI